jgi:tetratricopeptide (TPR) repeat protein
MTPPAGAVDALVEAERHAADSFTRSQILIELADVYGRQGQAALAQQTLTQAVSLQQETPAFALPHVRLGALLFARREFQSAYDNFSRAEALTNPRYTQHDLADHSADPPVRAEALYYLSRLAIEWPGHNDAQTAIANADEAFSIEGSWRNREQACLSRIRFGRVTPAAQASGYCSAAGQSSPTAEAYLLDGMYNLRRGHGVSGGDRNRALEAAYRAFTDGLRVLPESETAATRQTKARLLQGLATAQFCVGFATLGHDLEASIARQLGGADADAVARDAHTFFDDYRVMTCEGSTHRH